MPPALSIDMIVDDLLYVRAGDPFRIPASIKGRPVPKVTWEYDGKAKSHKKNKLHTLPVDSEVKLPHIDPLLYGLSLCCYDVVVNCLRD